MTADEYLASVRALLPALQERAQETERLRRMSDVSVKDFQDARLFRGLQPKRYGGHEVDPAAYYQAVMEVSSVCASSGWLLGVISVHSWHLSLYHPQAQEDVWGKDPGTLLSTSLSPTGSIVRVEGGFRVRGRWAFSSGCDFCQWALLGVHVPSPNEGEPPDLGIVLVPRRDYVIEDTWHAMGLCGTGSKDVVVEDAFVPAYRVRTHRDAFYFRNPGAAINDAPLYKLPFGVVFPNALTAAAIGTAMGALKIFREQMKPRASSGPQTRSAEDPSAQYVLAEAAAEIDAARERLLGNVAEMMRLVQAGEEIPLTQRARYRWDAAKGTDWSVRAVDRLFSATGGRGIYMNNPLQRAWRDIHAMRAHVANRPEAAASVFGRSELGLPPKDLRF